MLFSYIYNFPLKKFRRNFNIDLSFNFFTKNKSKIKNINNHGKGIVIVKPNKGSYKDVAD